MSSQKELPPAQLKRVRTLRNRTGWWAKQNQKMQEREAINLVREVSGKLPLTTKTGHKDPGTVPGHGLE